MKVQKMLMMMMVMEQNWVKLAKGQAKCLHFNHINIKEIYITNKKLIFKPTLFPNGFSLTILTEAIK